MVGGGVQGEQGRGTKQRQREAGGGPPGGRCSDPGFSAGETEAGGWEDLVTPA